MKSIVYRHVKWFVIFCCENSPYIFLMTWLKATMNVIIPYFLKRSINVFTRTSKLSIFPKKKLQHYLFFTRNKFLISIMLSLTEPNRKCAKIKTFFLFWALSKNLIRLNDLPCALERNHNFTVFYLTLVNFGNFSLEISQLTFTWRSVLYLLQLPILSGEWKKSKKIVIICYWRKNETKNNKTPWWIDF